MEMREKLIPIAIAASTALLAGSSHADTQALELKRSDSLGARNKKLRGPAMRAESGMGLHLAETLSLQLLKMPPPDPARTALLERARFWQSRNRDDLVAEALEKLLAVAPDDPDGLAQLAFLHLRNNQKDKAKQVLARLRQVQAGHPDIARLETLIRLDESDKERLRQARMLARAGRTEEALAALRALYPKGPPSSDLALEYWLLVADTATGWDRALAGLRSLTAQYPDNLRYRLALNEHVTIRQPNDPAALKAIIELTKLPPFDKPARAAWRRAMLRLAPEPGNLSLVRQYLEAEEVEDTAVKEHLASMQQAIEEHRRLMADPYYRARLDGLAMLDGGRLDVAEERLLHSVTGRPTDPDVLGGLGLLRMRQGHHAEAQAYFLQAQQHDPNAARWTGLLRTVRFWGLMREASDAADANEFALAENKLKEARAIDPREPEALSATGRLHMAQGRNGEAEAAFREALRMEATNSGAIKGLATLYLRTGRDPEIVALLARVAGPLRKDVEAAIDAARANIFKEKAEALLARGDHAEAMLMLEQAAALDRDDPWLRYSLARLYVAQGQPRKGDALFSDLLARRPDDAAARYAYALVLSGQDLRIDALGTLERVAVANRTSEMSELQRRLWTGAVVQRAQDLTKEGRTAAALKLLDHAQKHLASDPVLLLDIVDARIDAGDIAGAHATLVQLAETDAPSIDWRLRHARLLAAAAGDDMVPAIIHRLDIMKLEAAQAAALDELKLNLVLRNADNLRRENRLAEASQLLASELASHPNNARLLSTQARYWRAQRMPEKAADNYRSLKELDPQNRDAAIGLIEVLIETGRRDEAAALIEMQLANLQSATADQLADLVAALIDLGNAQEAQGLIATSLEFVPDHPRLLAYAGRLAMQEGRTGFAISYLQRSLAMEAQQRPPHPVSQLRFVVAHANDINGTKGTNDAHGTLDVITAPPAAAESNSSTYRRLADLLDRENTWLSSAIDRRSRSGSAGTSEYALTEIPLEWKQPQAQAGRWTYRADLVEVQAGGLDLAASGETFGSALLCQADCRSGIVAQRARGVAVNAMLERDNVRYDIGTTPLGFPVQSVVGGILRKGDLGPFGYSLDISRRPLTGSLLSYAGTRDPRTGQTWGGVQATGMRLGLSLDDGGTVGAWSSLGLHRLTGKNVLANDRLQLMAGAMLRVINEDDRLLQFGVTGMHWRLSENAGEYTFGHGGYYSPARFTSLSLPVTYGQRHARWSYALRASVSASRSQTNDAPYFPTDAGMQAEAERLAATNGVTPTYTGGPGSGTGRSLALSWEYQAQSRVFLGGRAELDRSADYSPNRFVLYLRYAFDRVPARPVAFLPEPVNPTSQY